MPPLQDITHRFISPLPPSSPALSYIDESFGNEYNKAEPSSAFLALSTSSKAYPRLGIPDDELVFDKENKENLPPFELEDEFDPLPGPDGPSTSAAVLFSTPKKSKTKADGSPPSSDPFGFLAVERKLKLERNQAKRSISGRRESEPEPKRQKLGSRSTPIAHALPRVTPSKKVLRSAKLKTRTPVARHAVGFRAPSPPAASPFHDQGRKRRRDTLSFDDENPFVDSPRASTPSPSKRRQSPSQPPVLFDKANDVDYESVSPSPTVQKKKLGVSETKNKRKRTRIAEDEDVGNQTLSALAHDPQLLANILQSRLPKRRVRQRTEAVTKPAQRSGPRRKKRQEEAVDEDEQEIEKDEEQEKRRSSRLAMRESREAGSSKAGNEETKKTTLKKPTRKTKGKENSGKKIKTSSSHIGTTTRATKSKKPASKAKEERQHQNSDDANEEWERRREARRAYFEELDTYELETESIYVI